MPSLAESHPVLGKAKECVPRKEGHTLPAQRDDCQA